MIDRLVVRNFKLLRYLDFQPHPTMNLIVGDNESGKSTLLEALSFVLTGRARGRRLADEISPYWFNQDSVKEFFTLWKSGARPEPPSIEIEAYFDQNLGPATFRGKVNSMGADVPGMRLLIGLDEDFREDFIAYMDHAEGTTLLPVEYFRVNWMDFRDMGIPRRPLGMGVVMIDDKTSRSTTGLDWHTRQLVQEMADRRTSAKLSVTYRKDRVDLAADLLGELNNRVQASVREYDLDSVSLAPNWETDGWQSTLAPHVADTPLHHAGQGRQVIVKTGLALQTSATDSRIVLVEEPENHLSHTSLRRVLDMIETLAAGRQCFVTTHSSYVVNRLGLDKICLIHEGRTTPFMSLTAETVEYFQRQSGFDTLRTVLAHRVVIVEGPSDEMVFNRAYEEKTGRSPARDGVDVITYGTANRRPLEILAALGKRAAVLRDADKRDPVYWRAMASQFLSEDRQMFVGNPVNGVTLEPQLAHANAGDAQALRGIVGCPDGEDLAAFMEDAKTESAWAIATSDDSIQYPEYINEAVDFIRPQFDD